MSRVVMPRADKARIVSICALQPRLPLSHELRLEGALPGTLHLDIHMSLLACERFLTRSIARIPEG